MATPITIIVANRETTCHSRRRTVISSIDSLQIDLRASFMYTYQNAYEENQSINHHAPISQANTKWHTQRIRFRTYAAAWQDIYLCAYKLTYIYTYVYAHITLSLRISVDRKATSRTYNNNPIQTMLLVKQVLSKFVYCFTRNEQGAMN